jgi:hypothetical protein
MNPPFELLLGILPWKRHKMARTSGEKRNLQWDEMIDKLSPLLYRR